jgi:predicted dehydrogenase
VLDKAGIVLDKPGSAFKTSDQPIARQHLFLSGAGMCSAEQAALPFRRDPGRSAPLRSWPEPLARSCAIVTKGGPSTMDLERNPVRLGLVGLGYWGERVAEAASATAGVEITHCFARTGATREAFAARYGYQPLPSYEAMLEQEEIEAVALITPNRVHHEQIMQAIAHGKHIFVDKPITATVAEGVEVVKAVDEARLVLGTDHLCRWERPQRRMKDLLERGALGRLLMVDANISSNTGLGIEPGEWRWERSECPGGPLIQIGIHHIDTLQYWLGPIVRVQGWQKHRFLKAPIDDTTVTLLEFENGMLGYLGSGYASAGAAWIRVYGDAAVGVYDRTKGLSFDGEPLHSQAGDWRVPPASFADPIAMIQDALVDFARAVRTGGQAEVGAREALSALAVVLGAVQSGETGKAVDIRELLTEAGADWSPSVPRDGNS